MARVVGGGMVGELAGKVGSLVFAKNKRGAYVRQYVKPTNPDTTSQSQARTKFANATTQFSSLGTSFKSEWNGFALSGFRPKKGVNTGQFTGQNAFTAYYNVINNAIGRLSMGEIKVNDVALVLQPTFDPVVFNFSPPDLNCVGAFTSSDLGEVYVNSITAGLNANYSGTIDLNFNDNAGNYPDLSWIAAQASNTKRGLLIYVSSGNHISGMTYKNMEQNLIGAIPNPNFQAGDLDDCEKITFTLPGIPGFAGIKTLPTPGQWFKITVYVFDPTSGSSLRIGVSEEMQQIL